MVTKYYNIVSEPWRPKSATISDACWYTDKDHYLFFSIYKLYFHRYECSTMCSRSVCKNRNELMIHNEFSGEKMYHARVCGSASTYTLKYNNLLIVFRRIAMTKHV